MSEDSYIKMDSKRVIYLCNLKMQQIKNQQAFEKRERIQAVQASRDGWRRWFPWMRQLTDEEAWEIGQDRVWGGLSWWLESDARQINRIILLAAESTEVFLSNTDYQRIR